MTEKQLRYRFRFSFICAEILSIHEWTTDIGQNNVQNLHNIAHLYFWDYLQGV